MQFSIWDYLKERARKATLAGIAEALDEMEGQDSEASHEAAVNRLRAHLGGQVGVKQLPEPANVTTAEPAPSNGKINSPPPAGSRSFGEGIEPTKSPAPTKAPVPAPDPFAERLNGPVPKSQAQDRGGPSRNGQGPALPEFDPPPPKPESPERRKRGRPRKDHE